MEELSIKTSPITKASQTLWAEQIIRPLLDGEIEPIDFIVRLKGLKNTLDEAEKNERVKDIIVRQLYRENNQASCNGVKITLKEGGVKYDYSGCGDSVYADLQAQKQELDRQIKEREAFLKAVPDMGMDIVNEDTGEIHRVYKPVRMASETYSITFPK